MANDPAFLEKLARRDPEFGELVSAINNHATADGELSAKTKALIGLAIDAGMSYPNGVRKYAQTARDEGATEGEIAETLAVVTSMCGLQGLSTGVNAFQDDD